MNNTPTRNFHAQSGYNNQTSIASHNQHPSRLTNTRLNYQPAFNQNTLRPPYPRVPNASNINLPPSTPFHPPHSSLNTTYLSQNLLQNAPSSQQNFSQPQSRGYSQLNIKQPQNVQSFNSSTTLSNSPSYAIPTSFPLNHINHPLQAQPIACNTSFQAKDTSSFEGQSNLVPPPHNLHIARPPNVAPHHVNYHRNTSNSYNPNFTMSLPPPGMPPILPGMGPTQPHMPQTQLNMSLTPSVIPVIQNLPSQLIDKSSTPVNQSFVHPPFMPQNMPVLFPPIESCIPPAHVEPVSEKEKMLSSFLEKFSFKEKKKSENVTVAQFRTSLKQGLHLVKTLMLCKENLTKLLKSDEKEWALEVNKVIHYQNLLTQTCSVLTMPKVLNSVLKKLESIKKKRNSKKKIKQNVLKDRMKKLKDREQLNQEIDKWLDSIKEKNLKLKRETEMKKEADSILSEVRRKLQEARRTVEKIKIFEKLRTTRQSNAAKKGLFLPEHDERFKHNISNLKETVYRQLSHYESEEKALKVMLEAEQEGQLEEEAKWKIKRMRTLQEKRQKNINESLFGDFSEEPEEDEPIYLFYQFQNSGNKSIENLVQIRHQWDVHVNENGEPVPLQWVVPVPPSSSGWEVMLNS